MNPKPIYRSVHWLLARLRLGAALLAPQLGGVSDGVFIGVNRGHLGFLRSKNRDFFMKENGFYAQNRDVQHMEK